MEEKSVKFIEKLQELLSMAKKKKNPGAAGTGGAPRLRGGIFLPDGEGGLRPAEEDAVQLSLHGVWLPAGEGRHRGGDFAMRAAARSPGRGPGAGGICRPGGWPVRNDTAFINPP